MPNPAPAEHEIHPLLAKRWSPRAFAAREVEREEILSLLEAARWAPSCFNEQPWFFITANRKDTQEFDRMLSCLTEANQKWTASAPLLMISVAKLFFKWNGKPNRHAFHDVGLAAENMAVQAVALGLAMHQMAGFDAAKAKEVYGIPEGHEPVAAIAIGYEGDPEMLPPDLREREKTPRERKGISSFVFHGAWGKSL